MLIASKKGKVKEGVSVDRRHKRGWTPLHLAAGRGRYDVVEFLISLPGCDLNPKDRDGWTPVLLAANGKEKRVVDLLLQRGAKVNCADEDKYTLLHHVSYYGWSDVVRRILERGEADPNAATRRGDTPLMWAAFMGNEYVTALLIRAGADVNRSDNRKWTALHFSAFHGSTRVVQVLLQEEGLDLNPQNEDGRTPLHDACMWGRREVIKQLLAAGADTTIKDKEGETALSVGIRRGVLTSELIKLLVQHGAFLQECDYVRISQNRFFKDYILKDVAHCTQSIINRFHRQSLPALDSISYFAGKLPRVDNFKLKPQQMEEVENLVKCEIERNTFCNVVKVHPTALSALCVLSLITCQSGTKRSASPDFSDSNSPFKKLHSAS